MKYQKFITIGLGIIAILAARAACAEFQEPTKPDDSAAAVAQVNQPRDKWRLLRHSSVHRSGPSECVGPAGFCGEYFGS